MKWFEDYKELVEQHGRAEQPVNLELRRVQFTIPVISRNGCRLWQRLESPVTGLHQEMKVKLTQYLQHSILYRSLQNFFYIKSKMSSEWYPDLLEPH